MEEYWKRGSKHSLKNTDTLPYVTYKLFPFIWLIMINRQEFTTLIFIYKNWFFIYIRKDFGLLENIAQKYSVNCL